MGKVRRICKEIKNGKDEKGENTREGKEKDIFRYSERNRGKKTLGKRKIK